MSYRALYWAWRVDTLLSVAQRAVLMVLAGYENEQTGRCDPSVGAIARRAGLGESTTRRVLRELEGLGLIFSTSGGGRAKTNAYMLARMPEPVDNGDKPARSERVSGPKPARSERVLPDKPARSGRVTRETRPLRAENPPAAGPESGFESENLTTSEQESSPRKRAHLWIKQHGWPTGARLVRGEVGTSLVYDPLGVEPITVSGWPHAQPSFEDVVDALTRAAGNTSDDDEEMF